ncbi:MAG TPA: response regulator [Candidatus Saccharimonadales bacterium]|nr:response regulator [Candidatus Saccharimonadales bacterium]
MPRILLIEDDEMFAALYKRQFILGGIDVDVAVNGTDGLSSVTKKRYDLVLLDILLPDLDGTEVFRQMKAQDSTKNIPVVFLTNLSQEENIEKAFQLGAKGYLVKASYTPDQVVQEIKNFLEQNKPLAA